MTLPLLNVPTWATYIKGQLYFSERKEKDTDTERHATFLPGSQVSTHFYQYSAADLPDALKSPPAFSVMLYFPTSVCFGESFTHPQYFLGSTGFQGYFLHLDRVTCPGNSFNQTNTSVGAWHPTLASAPSKCGGIVIFQSSSQRQLRLGPDTLVLLPPHLCSVSFPLP